MKTLIHRSADRGHNNFGWLDSFHSFSFGRYYDPEKMGFGMLRVLNDDIVEGAAGFGTHPHDNMEIISIPLQGAIEHKDSTGTIGVIHTGDVQIMSAGTGITHSEYNHSKSDKLNFLQLWVIPKEKNIKPRYAQRNYSVSDKPDQWHTVVAPDREEALWINQDAYFSLLKTTKDAEVNYQLRNPQNGVYIFTIEGNFSLDGNQMNRRDAIGISGTAEFKLKAASESYLLAVEVPLS